TRPCSWMSFSFGVSGSPERSLSSTLYRLVSVSSRWADSRSCRCASRRSAALLMRDSCSRGSCHGKGNGSKQRVLLYLGSLPTPSRAPAAKLQHVCTWLDRTPSVLILSDATHTIEWSERTAALTNWKIRCFD